jgi:hypothetical protein
MHRSRFEQSNAKQTNKLQNLAKSASDTTLKKNVTKEARLPNSGIAKAEVQK